MSVATTPPVHSISLFWRTFLLLGALLLGSVMAWFQTFRALEEEPRALQGAQQLASVVNLTRAAMVHADAIARVSLVKTLVEQENVRIAVREPSDTHKAYDQDPLSRRISESLASRLGEDTIVAREVNGFPGLWIGFVIEDDNFWLLADPERVGSVKGETWLVWLAIAGSLSLLGAAVFARLLNRPLKQLSAATARVRDGDFESGRLDEQVATVEIREVNIGFNRMAEQLAKAEADRTLMLAGISHDLRTPLARLRLETEMSVPEETPRQLMAADIEQVTAIIDKFLDYARAEHVQLDTVCLNDVIQAALQPYAGSPDSLVHFNNDQKWQVKADGIELRRVLDNLLENASRYGRGPDHTLKLDLHASREGQIVKLVVTDHGAGAPAELLPRLMEPFFRANEARTAATGSGLGLAIAARTMQRMGGQLTLRQAPTGGLAAELLLRAA